MIIGLVSTYNEGRLAFDAVCSLLPAVDLALVLDGPIRGAASDGGVVTRFSCKDQRVLIRPGKWESDASKRTVLLQWAQERHDKSSQPLWVVVLDGDEILLWGEYLPAMIERAEAETAAGGFAIRLVELDGSVSATSARVFRGDKIASYVTSGYELRPFGSSITLSLGNQFLWRPGMPEDGHNRRPLHGEPHILHRSLLRKPDREARRMHELEGESFRQLERESLGREIT